MKDSYADFAELYDAVVSTDNPAKIAFLKELIAAYQPQAQTLLELGCGTGSILLGFADEYQLTGLDLSPEMLKVAASKVPQATLVQGDMSSFDLDQQYDIILCIFDSINHLLEFSQWEQTFAAVARHLNPGGLFIFDVNTRAKLDRRVKQPVITEQAKDYKVQAKMEHTKGNLYQWQIIVASSDNFTKPRLYTVIEAAFPVWRIETAAAKHFEVQQKLTEEGISASEADDRVYFVCQ